MQLSGLVWSVIITRCEVTMAFWQALGLLLPHPLTPASRSVLADQVRSWTVSVEIRSTPFPQTPDFSIHRTAPDIRCRRPILSPCIQNFHARLYVLSISSSRIMTAIAEMSLLRLAESLSLRGFAPLPDQQNSQNQNCSQSSIPNTDNRASRLTHHSATS